MTNYEKFKAMSVEEMAEFLYNYAIPHNCIDCFAYGGCSMQFNLSCKELAQMWLESEVEENMLPEICSCGYRFEADETICPNCGKKVEEDD